MVIDIPVDEAAAVLRSVAYYRFSGYALPFRDVATGSYTGDLKFSDVVALYRFDCRLRELVGNALGAVEVTLRTILADEFSSKYGPLFTTCSSRRIGRSLIGRCGRVTSAIISTLCRRRLKSVFVVMSSSQRTREVRPSGNKGARCRDGDRSSPSKRRGDIHRAITSREAMANRSKNHDRQRSITGNRPTGEAVCRGEVRTRTAAREIRAGVLPDDCGPLYATNR